MHSHLNEQETAMLVENFRLQAFDDAAPELITGDQLIREERLTPFLEEASAKIDSDHMLVTASQFSKKYSFMATLPILAAMTLFDKALDARPENMIITSDYQNGMWLPALKLKSHEAISYPIESPQLRNIWREQLIMRLFAGNLSKVNKALSRSTGVPEPILWENTATYVFWLYETRLKELGAPLDIIQDDFDYIVHKAPGFAFGMNCNPLTPFYTPVNKHQTRMRKTCCQYYRLPGAGYCSTCRKGCSAKAKKTKAVAAGAR